MTLLQVGGAPTRLAALIAKSIDATIVEPPDDKKAQEAGMRLLAYMEDMNIPFQHTGLVTNRAQLAKSPDMSRRVVKSFVVSGPAQFPAAQTLPDDRRLQGRLRRTRRANPRGKKRRPQRLHRYEIPGRTRPQRLHRRAVSLEQASMSKCKLIRLTAVVQFDFILVAAIEKDFSPCSK